MNYYNPIAPAINPNTLQDIEITVLHDPRMVSITEKEWREAQAMEMMARRIGDIAKANPGVLIAVDVLEKIWDETRTTFVRRITKVSTTKVYQTDLPQYVRTYNLRTYNLKERIKILFTGKL